MTIEQDGSLMPPENHEAKTQQPVAVVLAAEGMSFGDGTISVKAKLESHEISPEALNFAIELTTTRPELYVPVQEADDGCGDGRPTTRIFRKAQHGLEKVTEHFNKSHLRAKIFGGGLVVAASMWRSIAGRPQNGETIFGDREFMAKKLLEQGIAFGAHTDDHAAGTNCGCGAIDKTKEIAVKAAESRQKIQTVLELLYGDSFEENQQAISQVFEGYQALAADEYYFSNAEGTKTMELILDEGAVVKQLAGSHMEDVVLLNDVSGTTFDQAKLDQLLHENGSTTPIQAFVIDVWRGRMYADAVAKVAQENLDVGSDKIDELKKLAYADFLIRTIAVSAVLTAGDQPVLARYSAGRSDFALAA